MSIARSKADTLENSAHKHTMFSWLAGFFAVFAAITGITTIILSANQFSDIRANWLAYDLEVEPKIESLAEIKKHMGYGGFIHAFKNYVLRNDVVYFQDAVRHMDHADQEIDAYLTVNTTTEEDAAIAVIRGTIEQYREKLNNAKQFIALGLETREIDTLVKVDDRGAHQAMLRLETYLQEQRDQHGNLVLGAVNDGTSLVEVSSFALPLSMLSLIFVVWSMLSMGRQTKSVSTHLRAVVDNAFDAIIAYDENGQIHSVNPKAEDMFGYCAEEFYGKHIGVVLPKVAAGLCEVFGKEDHGDISSQTWECIGQSNTGHVFPIELAVTYLERADGNLVVAFLRDITVRKEAEQSLVDLRNRLETVLKSSPAVIYTAAPDKVSQPNFVSDNIFDLFGYFSSQLINNDSFWTDCIHPEDVPALFMANRKLKTIGNRVVEYRVQLADGSWRWAHDEALVVYHEDGVGEIVGSIIDVTDKREAVEERIAAQGALHQSQKMEALGQLSGGMAHEFNNMLVPMICLTELTIDDLPEGSEARDNLETSLDAALKARGLIQQILAYARSDNRVFGSIHIKDAVSQAVKMLRASLPTNVEVIEDIGIGENLTVRCDPTEVNQVLMNLGRNAAHAMGPTGGRLEIRISKQDLGEEDIIDLNEVPTGPCIVLQVRDNGCGMDDDTCARVFDPFFTTKEVGEGTGMGLSVVHGIVKDCGGDIQVSSVPGKGSVFQVYLPLSEKEQRDATSAVA